MQIDRNKYLIEVTEDGTINVLWYEKDFWDLTFSEKTRFFNDFADALAKSCKIKISQC